MEAVLEQADFSTLREVIRAQALNRVGSDVMPAIVDEETAAVESYEVTEEEAGGRIASQTCQSSSTIEYDTTEKVLIPDD